MDLNVILGNIKSRIFQFRQFGFQRKNIYIALGINTYQELEKTQHLERDYQTKKISLYGCNVIYLTGLIENLDNDYKVFLEYDLKGDLS